MPSGSAANVAPAAPAKAASSPTIHTKFSRGLVLLALASGAAGLALGNPMLLTFAATIAVVLHASRAGWPGPGTVSLRVDADRVPRGSTVEAHVAAQAGRGPAAYWLHIKLPDAFSVVRGANLGMLAPGKATTMPMLLACPKRGAFDLPPATLTAVHPHLLAPSVQVAASEPAILTVEPRVKPLSRAKQIRAPARVPLGDDRARRGPRGADFREIREYERGDPLRAVNWKATAKRSTRDVELMVNEYEPEGRKNVWFFLDLSPRMEAGTTVDNALEDGIEAALALVQHFISRGHRVGGTTYNASPLVFYPEAGTRQQLAIARGLAQVQPGEGGEGLATAAERVRGFLVRERPLVFVITRPDLDPEGLSAGALRVQRYAHGRGVRPLYVIAPEPGTETKAEELALEMLALEGKARLRSTPLLRVIPLKDGAQSLGTALARGVMAK